MLPVSAVDLTGTEQVASFIMAIFLFLVMTSAVSYTMSIFSVGNTLMFIIFKNRTENDNILEKNDEDDIDDDNDETLSNEEFVQDEDSNNKDKDN